MRLCSIASSSSGNCIYVGSEATHLLVDVGISAKRIEAGLKEIGLKMGDIDGILITHEHADHIAGLGVLLRKYEIPVYATRGTIGAIVNNRSLGYVDEELLCEIRPDQRFGLKDVNVSPFRISHDAAEPVAYKVCYGSKRVGICTDLGVYNDYIVENLRGMDALLLEANHDVNMLQVGPYPYYLKQRILGERGHLSNENAGRLLSRIVHDNLKTIMLGHLSKENNIPDLAYEAVRMEITMGENPYSANDFDMLVAPRSEVSRMIEIL